MTRVLYLLPVYQQHLQKVITALLLMYPLYMQPLHVKLVTAVPAALQKGYHSISCYVYPSALQLSHMQPLHVRHLFQVYQQLVNRYLRLCGC